MGVADSDRETKNADTDKEREPEPEPEPETNADTETDTETDIRGETINTKERKHLQILHALHPSIRTTIFCTPLPGWPRIHDDVIKSKRTSALAECS